MLRLRPRQIGGNHAAPVLRVSLREAAHRMYPALAVKICANVSSNA
jgi:hypothetical protein